MFQANHLISQLESVKVIVRHFHIFMGDSFPFKITCTQTIFLSASPLCWCYCGSIGNTGADVFIVPVWAGVHCMCVYVYVWVTFTLYTNLSSILFLWEFSYSTQRALSDQKPTYINNIFTDLSVG